MQDQAFLLIGFTAANSARLAWSHPLSRASGSEPGSRKVGVPIKVLIPLQEPIEPSIAPSRGASEDGMSIFHAPIIEMARKLARVQRQVPYAGDHVDLCPVELLRYHFLRRPATDSVAYGREHAPLEQLQPLGRTVLELLGFAIAPESTPHGFSTGFKARVHTCVRRNNVA